MIRFCTEHQISIAALYKIRAAAARDGAEQAVVPKSTAPKSQAKQTSADIEQAALKIRSDLIRQGWDAGSLSVADQMRRLGLTPPSRATLARIFTRNGVVTPQPNKKPRAAWHRFTYPDPNVCLCTHRFPVLAFQRFHFQHAARRHLVSGDRGCRSTPSLSVRRTSPKSRMLLIPSGLRP